MPPRKRAETEDPRAGLVDRIIAQLDGVTLSLEEARRLTVAVRACKG